MAQGTPTRKRSEPGRHFCLLALGLVLVLIAMVFLIHRNSVAPVDANPPANTYQRN
jgi:Tfp pilus assembly protein PilN